MKVLVVQAISGALTAGARCARILVNSSSGTIGARFARILVKVLVVQAISGALTAGARCARIPASG